MQVSWPSAEPVAGSPVAGYEVQWASGGRDWDTRQRAVVVGLSYTIFGLDDATAYTVRVRPAAVETASVGGASITVGAGAGPIVEIVEDAPALGGSTLRSVSTLPGAVNFEVTGEAVWPATITIPVNMSLVAEDSDVQLVYYNESLTAWVPVPGSVLDRDRGVMTAEVYHLTVHDVVCFFTPVVCGAVTLGVNALRAMKEFVDSAWDANRGWLREGWLEAREFVLQDVPVLAQAMLDKLRETGQTIAPWALAFLKAAIGLNPETLGYMKSMLLAELGVGVSPPECHSQQPGWAETSFVASSDALLWCAETASDDGGSGQDMGLVHTVNRGYSLLMSRNRSSVKFGDPSPDRISVDEAEFPTSLADLGVSGFYGLITSGASAFLPAGSTTRFRVPRSALGAPSDTEFEYKADQTSTLLQALLWGTSALTGGRTSTITGSVNSLTSIAQCAWGTFAKGSNAQSSTLVESMEAVVSKCAPEAINRLSKSVGAATFFLAVGGFILLYEYGRIAIDNTFIHDAHKLTISATPDTPTSTQQDAQPTPPDDAPEPPTPGGVTLTVGADAQGQPGCATEHCRHLQIDLPSWPVGVYDVACWSSQDTTKPWYPDPDKDQIGRWQWPQSELWTEGGCWYGHPGDQVWITINGTPSNTITWPTTTPPPTTGPGTYTAITAGAANSCGLRSDGTITCWGRNDWGEAEALAGSFTAITAGANHLCGLRTDGTIACSGNNREGQTEAPAGTFTTISASEAHSCGLRTDSTITCWGNNDYGQTEAPTGTFTAVAAGWQHSCGLRTDSTITCWGNNDYGKTEAPAGAFTAVAVGSSNSCGLRTDGTITCWGQTEAPAGAFTTIDAGLNHWCGLRTDSTITCWGYNRDGETDAPAGTFTTIDVGAQHSCGLRTDSTITCWGQNEDGEADATAGAFTAIAAGWGHSCGLRTDGTITCWGDIAFDLRGDDGGRSPVPTTSDRSVVLSQGRNAQGVDARCSSANCYFLRVELVGFDLSAGPYAVRCWHYAVPSAGWEHAEWANYTTAQAVSEYCIWGVADHDVYVIVEDPRTGEAVRSDDAGWP